MSGEALAQQDITPDTPYPSAWLLRVYEVNGGDEPRVSQALVKFSRSELARLKRRRALLGSIFDDEDEMIHELVFTGIPVGLEFGDDDQDFGALGHALGVDLDGPTKVEYVGLTVWQMSKRRQYGDLAKVIPEQANTVIARQGIVFTFADPVDFRRYETTTLPWEEIERPR